MSNKKNAKHSDKHHGKHDKAAEAPEKLSKHDKHEKRAKDKHKEKKDKHAAPIKERADHHDAELVLKLYDLRREAVMRQSRDALFKFVPSSYEEFVAITQPSHPENAAFRQVSSYFEMAYGFARHGIVHADLLAESTAEGLILFAKVKPYLERFRAEASPTAFRNAEWLVEHSAVARQRFELFEKRFAKQRGS
jgi:hypothetical protein